MLQPAHTAEEPAASIFGIWIGGERRPQFRPVGKNHFPRKDPNHCVRLVVELNDSAQDVSISLKQALPEIVAEQRYLSAARAILFRKKISPQYGLQAENVQQVIGNFGSEDALSGSAVGKVETALREERHAVESGVVAAPDEEVLNRDANILEIPFRRCFIQVDYPFGFGEGKGPQKESIENAENCGVTCNTQR